MLNYENNDWKLWRPAPEWILVKADPRVKKTKGGIILTDTITGIERVMEGSGRVLKIGNRVLSKIKEPLEPGERVLYRGFLKDATQHLFAMEDDCPIFLIHCNDILAVISDDLDVGLAG